VSAPYAELVKLTGLLLQAKLVVQLLAQKGPVATGTRGGWIGAGPNSPGYCQMQE